MTAKPVDIALFEVAWGDSTLPTAFKSRIWKIMRFQNNAVLHMDDDHDDEHHDDHDDHDDDHHDDDHDDEHE